MTLTTCQAETQTLHDASKANLTRVSIVQKERRALMGEFNDLCCTDENVSEMYIRFLLCKLCLNLCKQDMTDVSAILIR